MLEDEHKPSRRVFDMCDLTYAFAECAVHHIPKRKCEELVKRGVPVRILNYFIEDPERFDRLTNVQLGRLIWSMSVLRLLRSNDAAKAITEALRKNERYKNLTGRNLVRVAEALKGIKQVHPGRRHLGDRIMGQILRQRNELQKMGLLVEGLRAAGELTVVNSVTQHKLVDLFLKVIVPQADTAQLMAIPGCLDSIKLADDVVFEEWVNRFLLMLTEGQSDGLHLSKDDEAGAAFGKTLKALCRFQVGPPGLTSSALGILTKRISAFVRQGEDGQAPPLSNGALITVICGFRSLGHDSCVGMSQKRMRDHAAELTQLLTVCFDAVKVSALSSEELLRLAVRAADINTGIPQKSFSNCSRPATLWVGIAIEFVEQ
ncbi:hypothetical protein Pmar_PMAR006574 [Perkinsus marinus ATCC 50983]|uniref:Uncharacterized protein n=1 Tax=Perkinsus marinus (strain ATCC 50983 / TXsc) TaxID=423536 RepID=C5LTT7_PERM5|nr:hypothetical protein Pmar_PMAR006574 [Perkinsus marinus ATCC 50983]EEQ99899.1 hypothetical protein Pmar_PMAR006574 [Perkinsus marinus ATCC 50983]|eukprot:XP_002767182.1 hypothetical protein Pmar_PMAR006574 [Perkinsus marinus ATCC 50983]